jgi:hypothetical protein
MFVDVELLPVVFVAGAGLFVAHPANESATRSEKKSASFIARQSWACNKLMPRAWDARDVRIPQPYPAHAFEPAPEAQAFRFQSGTFARSLAELEERLASEGPFVVWYHRDHFPPWLRDVGGDAPLARRFAQFAAESPEPEALRAILSGLVRTRLAELRALAHRV